MKILYVDGDLHEFLWDYERVVDRDCGDGCFTLINAAYGYSNNKAHLENLMSSENSSSLTILTNSLTALSHFYGWDEELDSSNIFIWQKEEKEFIHVDELYGAHVKYAQDVEKLYIGGCLGVIREEAK